MLGWPSLGTHSPDNLTLQAPRRLAVVWLSSFSIALCYLCVCGVPVVSCHQLTVQVFNVSSPLTPPTPHLRGCGRGCCCNPALWSSSCAIWFKVHYRCCRGRHTSPVQGSFIGTVLGRCSTVDDEGRGWSVKIGLTPHFFPLRFVYPLM